MSRTRIPADLRRRVSARARHRCGYCLSTEAVVGMPMEMDHIIPEALGGDTAEDNLRLSCSLCNDHKGDRIAEADPATGELVRLFDPRRQAWGEHFGWTPEGDRVVGVTPCGRATVAALKLKGRLPPGFYALAEQIAGGPGPDVLALEGPRLDEDDGDGETSGVGNRSAAVAIAERPPGVRLHAKAEVDQYARKASAIAIRHSSNHKVVAVIEIVSPGNKSTRHALSKFVEKAVEFLDAGVHLLILDLIPPGPFDPRGIHAAIWEDWTGERFTPPPGQPLTLAAYIGGGAFEAYVEPTAIGSTPIDMPLFLDADTYVPTPLQSTYQSVCGEAVPKVWRKALEGDVR